MLHKKNEYQKDLSQQEEKVLSAIPAGLKCDTRYR